MADEIFQDLLADVGAYEDLGNGLGKITYEIFGVQYEVTINNSTKEIVKTESRGQST